MKQQDIQEYDEVKLRIALHSEGIEKGDTGTVVMLYGDPSKDADVEFPDPYNKGVKLVMIPLRYLERVEDIGNSVSCIILKQNSLDRGF